MRTAGISLAVSLVSLVGCVSSEQRAAPVASAVAARLPARSEAVPLGQVANSADVQTALRKLDIWLEGRRLKDDLASVSVGVVYDQDLLWSKGYGYADLERKIPASDRTLYRVASITKLFTSTAVMQLVERGRLSLEDPVSQHLSWFTPKDADPHTPIVVWNLLTHTAGLQRETPGADWDQLQGVPPEAMKLATAATPVKFAPRVRQKYSNYALEVVGQLVAELSGMPYREYMRTNVLDALGMTDTRFLDGDEAVSALATAYGRRGRDGLRPVEEQIQKRGLLAAGSLASSVRDLAKFASLQFRTGDDSTGPVLSGRSLREMHRPRWLAPDWSRGSGIGWFLLRRDSGIVMSHGGALPGFKSSLMVDPKNRVAVIVLSNSEDAGVGAIASGALKLVAGPIAEAAAPPESPPTVETDAARFEGLYRDRWGEYARVATVGGKLCVILLEADNIETATTTLERIGATTFRTHVGELRMGGDVEDVIEFAVDADGGASSFTTESGGYRFHRVE